MRYRTINIFNGLILVLLVSINILFYINRDAGFAYKAYLTYDQLYTLNESIKISDFKIKQDSLNVTFMSSNKNSNNASIKLKEGKHTYFIQISGELKPMELGINYVTNRAYKENGRTRNAVAELYYSNVSIENFKSYDLIDWQAKSEYTTQNEIAIVKKILSEELQLKTQDSSIYKVKKIATYILKNIDHDRGIPTDTMDTVSPWLRFNFAKQQKSKVWCGDFVSIFSFFALCADIPTRLVCLEGKVGDVYKPGHSFNEVFIKELNKWVFMDLTSKAILVQSTSHNYLNTIEFYQSHKLCPDNLSVTYYENDSLKTIDYSNIKPFYDYYFSRNNYFVYYFSSQFDKQAYTVFSKIKRYLFKAPTFATYIEAKDSDNEKFYLKQLAFCGFIGFSIYCCICFFLQKINRIKSN